MGLTRPKYSNIVDTDYKASVRVVTTTNITLSGGAPSTYDGLTLIVSDRILVAGQSIGSQNGIYTVTIVGTGSNGTWSRAFDASTSDRVTAGMRTFVAEGTYAGTEYRLVTPDPITLGTTSLSFASTAATVSGTNKSVQYNNSGFIAGATNLVYDNVTGNVTVAGTTATVSDSTGALVVKGGAGIAGNVYATGQLTVGGVAVFNSNVVVVGNLTTLGNTFITNTTDLSIQDSIINLHSPTDLTPLVTNDGLDIGIKFHYYDTVDSAAFLGRDNPTGYLVWKDRGSDAAGVFTSTSLGTFKVGNILLTGNTYRGTSTIGTAVQTHAIAYTTSSATPPSNPQVGDQWYDTSTDVLYEWFSDGVSNYWVDKLSQPVAISFASQTTVPIGSKQGDLWYDTSTDTVYTYVYDGSSNYWVDYSTAGVSTVAGLGALISNVSVGNITPYANLTYNVGSLTNFWSNIYVGNLFVSNLDTVRTITANTVSATQYNYANGVNILSGVGGTYSNSNVASFYSTTSNVQIFSATNQLANIQVGTGSLNSQYARMSMGDNNSPTLEINGIFPRLIIKNQGAYSYNGYQAFNIYDGGLGGGGSIMSSIGWNFTSYPNTGDLILPTTTTGSMIINAANASIVTGNTNGAIVFQTGATSLARLRIQFDGNTYITGNTWIGGALTLGNVSTGAAKNGYDVAKSTTFANIDNISASVFANGVPAVSSITGTLNYFWSAVTNLTGGKFFGNTSTGSAVTTTPTVVGSSNGPLGSGGDTVTAIVQDQDLKRVYQIIYTQTVTASSCAIVITRIM